MVGLLIVTKKECTGKPHGIYSLIFLCETMPKDKVSETHLAWRAKLYCSSVKKKSSKLENYSNSTYRVRCSVGSWPAAKLVCRNLIRTEILMAAKSYEDLMPAGFILRIPGTSESTFAVTLGSPISWWLQGVQMFLLPAGFLLEVEFLTN